MGYEIDVMDTLRFNNDVDFISRLATVLEMSLNRTYWRNFVGDHSAPMYLLFRVVC